MLEALFRSRVTVKLLGYFITHPDEEVYLRRVSREIEEPPSAVRRELERLEGFGFLTSKHSGNHKYFSVRKESPVLPELTGLFLKTEGAIDYLKAVFIKLDEVQLAFLYGDFAENPNVVTPEIELVVVGTISKERLESLTKELQSRLARKIEYKHYEPGEFRRLLEEKDPSLSLILDGEKIVLSANVANKE